MGFLDPGFAFRTTDRLFVPDGRVDRWRELPAADQASPPDDTAHRSSFTYDGGGFSLPATRASTFATLRTIFLLDGSPGIKNFFAGNGMMPKHVGVGEDAETLQPEDLLSGDALLLYGLLKAQREQVDLYRDLGTQRLQELAVANAHRRLDEAIDEIRRETIRYTNTLPTDTHVAGSLTSGFHGFLAGGTLPALQQELLQLRALYDKRRSAEAELSKDLLPKLAQAMRPYTGYADPGERQALARDYEREKENLLHTDAKLVELGKAVHERRKEYVLAVARSAVAYPIIWKLHRFEKPRDADALVREVHEVLSTAWQAAHALKHDIGADHELVWKFPPLIQETMRIEFMSETSIAWRACEDQMEEMNGSRLFSLLSMGTGLASMGAAALAGAMLIAPPVAVAIAAADAMVNTVDAVQEYSAYRTQRDAFDACLDPSRSLAVEPSALGAFFTIAMDMLGVFTQVKVP